MPSTSRQPVLPESDPIGLAVVTYMYKAYPMITSEDIKTMNSLASDPADAPPKVISEDVYERLMGQLITLEIPPGERISVDGLVRSLGVSQTPIRAALIKLEAEGLVVRRHNAGYCATPIPSGERFRQMYEFRGILEPEAAALAARSLTDAMQRELEAIGDEMTDLMKDSSDVSYGRFARLDAQLHAIIAEACGNDIINDALRRLHAHMHLFRLRRHVTVTEEAVKEHARILAGLIDGDAAAAASAMREHIDRSHDRMKPFYMNMT